MKVICTPPFWVPSRVTALMYNPLRACVPAFTSVCTGQRTFKTHTHVCRAKVEPHSLSQYLAKAPRSTVQTPCHQTLAKEVQDEGAQSEYLNRIRRKVDPEQDIKSLELEVLEEIALSLGKTADKANWSFYQLEVAQKKVRDHIQLYGRDKNGPRAAERLDLIRKYNEVRETAYEERRKLVIHRQACGFRTGNWQMIEKMYPLPHRILEE
ncbi:hypothetical protein SARC_14709 [Sphaeroforma arctica JP610]|uniref:Uncharacterized protein n=1 Tax=Sphaeroforma arctica JP610 TaxID=667725 RepID=A0A0L0F857_9EUKA|nr:hypothetical protein SARC_14709 [Sphaeroforma arctica JP610]KNC72731.1 hypothetical protein SARC_14709 [Sphaeroforma arctica JP610]|eukprot:XP_014146633.1 hypothetical protein SARC_14709 [Sphaeroforma arctica JP610]